MLSVHNCAIRYCVERVALKGTPHIWVSFDKWTDSVGNAMVDILVGVGNRSYVVQTVTLECHGPQHGCRAHRTCGRLKIEILWYDGMYFWLQIVGPLGLWQSSD